MSRTKDLEEKTKLREKILPIDEVVNLEKKGIKVGQRKDSTITYGDVEGLRGDLETAVPKTTITSSYIVEKIPVPSVNNVKSLSSNSFAFNKPKLITNNEDGDGVFITDDSNYITAAGLDTRIRIGGDIGTHYTIVVKDITNTKWYNWETNVFENGYNEKCGHCGEENATLIFPSQNLETTYNIFFEPSGSTNYDNILPTEENPWVVNQLLNVTTTFKFDSAKGYISDTESTKTHLPGDILDSGSINDGKINITIKTIPIRGTISLKTSNVKTEDIITTDDKTVIIDSDLTASVSDRVGTITGTIILGQSAIRDTNILFNNDQYFTIT